MKMTIYKNKATLGHPDHKIFMKRFHEAIIREKFERKIPENHTPLAVIKSSKYIIEWEGEKIFVLVPNILFEEFLNVLKKISNEENRNNQSPYILIKKGYTDGYFRELMQNWDFYSWSKSFESFYKHIIEESFFYFDNLKSQFYFNLFRSIKSNNEGQHEFIGGILHSLTRHFDTFTKYNPSPMGNSEFQYNTFIWKIINCSLFGKITGEKDYKSNGNYVINKELPDNDKTIRIGLFWDARKKLYFLNTVILKS